MRKLRNREISKSTSEKLQFSWCEAKQTDRVGAGAEMDDVPEILERELGLGQQVGGGVDLADLDDAVDAELAALAWIAR